MGDQKQDEAKNVPIMIFRDPVRKEPSSTIKKNHPSDFIIGNPSKNVLTKRRYVNLVKYVCFTSIIEPTNAKKALFKEFWVKAMQEELEQVISNDAWALVSRLIHMNVIRIKWIFKDKTDEFGNIIRNKARLIAQGIHKLRELILIKYLHLLIDKSLFVYFLL